MPKPRQGTCKEPSQSERARGEEFSQWTVAVPVEYLIQSWKRLCSDLTWQNANLNRLKLAYEPTST